MIYWLLVVLPVVWAGWLSPEQIRIAWTENEYEMRITWVTFLNTASLVWYKPILCTQSGETTVTGETRVINVAEELERTEYVHFTTLQNIARECTYEYQVGNGWFWSEVYTFSGRTPDYSPPYDDPNTPTSVVIFGDWGMGPWGWHTLDLLGHEAEQHNFDAILHIGDIAYDLNTLNGLIGDMYLRMVQPIVAQFPYMVGPGNHEDFNNLTQFIDRFTMPVNEANQGTNLFYSFNLGAMHYIMLNTEFFLDPNNTEAQQTQLNWLIDDLEQANLERDIRPWIVLGTHHPLYCSINWYQPLDQVHKLKSNSDCAIDTQTLLPILEDIYYNNKIDLVVQAHVHNYERDSPIYQNQTVPSDYDDLHTHINTHAPVYLVSGNAGNEEGHNDPTSPTPQNWCRWLSNDYGYGRITVNQTHLFWQQFSSMTKEQIDYLWVIKDSNYTT
jgi:hypothetical protein